MVVSRDEVPVKDRWNVEALYVNPDQWKEDFAKIGGVVKGPKWPELAQYKGKLQDPKAVAGLFDIYMNVQRKLEKLHTYAHLRMDEDLGNDSSKNDFGLISTLIHEFSLETSWIEPEFLSLNEEQFQKLLADSALSPYRFYLEKIGRMRPHTLSPEQEELMALSGKALDTSYRTFGALNNADLSFKPAIDSKGKEHPLTTGSYLSYLRDPDRNLRKTAFENLHRGYETHANTLCELIQGQVQSHLFVARARKFDSCLAAALFPNQIDRAVYENLIASVRKRLPLMHEYVALRKKLLKLPDIHSYDLYVPLVEDAESHMDYNEAREAVIASVAPLGGKYQESLQKGLTNDRWVDVYENMRKRSGAYSSGCYDSMPYILMNYHGTLNDVLTLAHEAGHSMHSLLSRTTQPYIYSQYPIFVAEVASTFNEQLLLKHLEQKVKSKKERAFLINYQIEGIRGTIYRQTLFAEFELQLHKWAEDGVPLTPGLLKKKYIELNRDYYGPELVLDQELEIEWARIPHFYYNFYVYQYATGLSAALSLFQQAMHNPGARDRYLEFLSSGGSKYPIDLLKNAGVDMKKPDVVNSALDHFEKLLNELKDCLN
ncbi:MAG: oligoendopeptidase F [Parachlamydiales bacterium]|nr:oligoendopeptidase F [Parachlamydiales bacterium]